MSAADQFFMIPAAIQATTAAMPTEILIKK